MPLDGRTYKPTIKPLQTGLAGLKQIGDVLRLPLHHKWDFAHSSDDCRSAGCALLTAHIVWPIQVRSPASLQVAKALGLSWGDMFPLFGMVGMHKHYGDKSHDQVTPTDVADAIDLYIAGQEAGRRDAEGRAA